MGTETSHESTGLLADRVAIVTGGTSGIGLGIARRLHEDNAKVVLVGRDPERGAAALRQLEGGAEVQFIPGDVSRDSQSVTEQVIYRFGALDILVNSAGFTFGPRLISETTDDDWISIEATNVRGMFQMTRAATAFMEGHGGGSVVCISSISGRGWLGVSNAAYAATKGGIISFVKAASLQLGQHGIRINCVCPGPTRTELFNLAVIEMASRQQITEQEADDKLVESFHTALGRIADASEVAAAVAFLASRDASGITGQSLNVDAGIIFD
jgi:NAD(P)-dependent dehydrogenase (short-subunit alcohol dehydrogenase family)